MLIKVAAPPPMLDGYRCEAMVPESPLAPGHPPPWIIPHCRSCGVMVERFTINWVSSPHYLPVEYQCHGKTGALRIPREEVLWKSMNGGIVWVFNNGK
jgi:hypothetical protein